MSNHDKKYQVFISSTYEDLKEERLAASEILLELGCIPIGMEQFPASNMSQMEYIKKMLDNCDYYILITAGRYGSIDQTDNCGYTEKEYDYAIKMGIPVMSFLYKDFEHLPNDKKDESDEKREKLILFREKISSSKLVKFYSSIDELKIKIATSLHQCMKDFPAIGWIRAEGREMDKAIQRKIVSYLREHEEFSYFEEDNEAGGKTVRIKKNDSLSENEAYGDRIVRIKNEIEKSIVDKSWIKTNEDCKKLVSEPWRIFRCNNIMIKDDSVDNPDYDNGLIKTEPYDFYDNGLLVISSGGIREIKVKYSEIGESYTTKVYVVNMVPFRRISGFDERGTINFPYPTLYCKFTNGSPFTGRRFFDTENGVEYEENQFIFI